MWYESAGKEEEGKAYHRFLFCYLLYLHLLLSPSERRHLPVKCATGGIPWRYVAPACQRQHLRSKTNCCRRRCERSGEVMSVLTADVALATCS